MVYAPGTYNHVCKFCKVKVKLTVTGHEVWRPGTADAKLCEHS